MYEIFNIAPEGQTDLGAFCFATAAQETLRLAVYKICPEKLRHGCGTVVEQT